ncbi:MAG: hypothetical protein Kow0092_01210 [Deferrisomatales bacterium]
MGLEDDRLVRAYGRLRETAPSLQVAVVGDVILDQFVYGAVERISPEAPVPVVEVEQEVFRPGGAANVVRNLTALGARASLFGVVGEDREGQWLGEELRRAGVGREGLVQVAGRPTALKTRVIAQHQQIVRFDRERREPVPAAALARLKDRLAGELPGASAVVVSDYGKGVVGGELMEALAGLCGPRGTYMAVDPKPVHVRWYGGASAITPNTKEIEGMTGLPARSDDEVARAARELADRSAVAEVLVTRGDRGMTLVESAGRVTHIPTRARDVFDVTGAGDTTIAVYTLARAAGISAGEAAALANLAAGIVVGKLGTAAVTADELWDAVRNGVPSGRRP